MAMDLSWISGFQDLQPVLDKTDTIWRNENEQNKILEESQKGTKTKKTKNFKGVKIEVTLLILLTTVKP